VSFLGRNRVEHPSVEQRVAVRLRKLRRARGLTLDAVAAAAGTSKSLLSKIENAKISSPISTYSRIATTLGATVGDLLGEGDGGPCVLVRHDERKLTPRRGTQFGYTYESLGHKKRDKRMEPFLLTYPAGFDRPPSFTHGGEEFIFLLKGRLEFVHGGSHFVLAPGDCLYFDGKVPHGGRALGRKNAVAVVVAAGS
jgi:transcriptional regulator with XRE-family HTH domain